MTSMRYVSKHVMRGLISEGDVHVRYMSNGRARTAGTQRVPRTVRGACNNDLNARSAILEAHPRHQVRVRTDGTQRVPRTVRGAC
jgi:hypothetical protein